MRHRVKGRKLGRTASHRRATLKSLSAALLLEHRIETTVAKAKELRTYIEPLITRAKSDTTHNRRVAFSYLQNKYAVTELFDVVAPAAADRPGGYTRVLKLGFRVGDAAEMAVIELVDFNDVKPEGKADKKKRTRRAGRSSAAQKDSTQANENKSDKTSADTDVIVEEVKAEETEVENKEITTVETADDPTPESSEASESDKKVEETVNTNQTEEVLSQEDTSDKKEKK